MIRLSREAWKPYAAALFTQLQRASLSTELNIVEGYSFGDTPNYTRHLAIAYGFAVEMVVLFRIGLETEVLPEATGRDLLAHSRSTQRLLLALLKHRRPFPR